MNLIALVCSMTLLCFVMAGERDALGSIDGWTDFIPQISAHSTFYPHPHMRDLKKAAKHGKILVITLIVSAGLVVLVSTAIIRSGKEKTDDEAAQKVDPDQLRSCVMAAVAAGRRGLEEGHRAALRMALSEYARTRGIDWEDDIRDADLSVTRSIGRDQVTVTVSDNGQIMEIRAVCRNIGFSATANMVDRSIRSAIFTDRAIDREF